MARSRPKVSQVARKEHERSMKGPLGQPTSVALRRLQWCVLLPRLLITTATADEGGFPECNGKRSANAFF